MSTPYEKSIEILERPEAARKAQATPTNAATGELVTPLGDPRSQPAPQTPEQARAAAQATEGERFAEELRGKFGWQSAGPAL